MRLITAMLAAPLAGATGHDSTVVHRIDIDGIPAATWETATTCTAVCGAEVRPIGVAYRNTITPPSTDLDPVRPVPWADIRTRSSRFTRCPECRTGPGPR